MIVKINYFRMEKVILYNRRTDDCVGGHFFSKICKRIAHLFIKRSKIYARNIGDGQNGRRRN